MASDELAARKHLTFAQAEGAVPLPSQLNRKDMPKKLRARLWQIIYTSISDTAINQLSRVNLGDDWSDILLNEYVARRGMFVHDFTFSFHDRIADLSPIFEKGNYIEIYDLLQFFIRSASAPEELSNGIADVLEEEMSAFRIIDGDTFVPLASDEEVKSLTEALDVTKNRRFLGARSHLRASAVFLSIGNFADSVRESIHAVEAVARTLEPSAELSQALSKIENSTNLHPAMKRGFTALYGYASDEDGIRHPLLDNGDAKVDEADAIFMIGACASFVTYLITKKNISVIIDV